ncbi:sugar kinase [Mangrovimicrobium sediminis]|uniref:Sugar kinase n=2 Tax=Mangrovimicrobium sediminis TaxID=2562682 RepID=A0A4Z0LXD5_9GAMM|nr:sugar kinase [Haliea sp. SAOS-164]
MVELAPTEIADNYRLGFAGDSFNTAITLARFGVPTAYATALGDDPFSARILDLLLGEGIEQTLVERYPGRQPGLYAITNDADGERSFHYWRSESPARELWAHDAQRERLERQLRSYSMLYLSGITLAILRADARTRLLAFLADYRRDGGSVAFDSNYRPRLWPDAGAARHAIGEFLHTATDIALLTLEDEQLLWGDGDAGAVIQRHSEGAAGEIVIKRGGEPVLLFADDRLQQVPVPAVAGIVDTTGAGDAFNAGYLAARYRGARAESAVQQGNRAAAAVIQRRGGVVPRDYFQQAMAAAGD